MTRIAVLVSGGGTNLQALIDARATFPDAELALVLSSNPDAYALKRAQSVGIDTVVVNKKDWPDRVAFTRAILDKLTEQRIDLVVLAGFMFVLSPEFCRVYENRVINIHPALIPSFCGDGMYGLRPHQAALDYGVKLTGATVHFVSPETDGGPIIAQRALDILPDDTAERLQRRVMEQCEWPLLCEAVRLYSAGALTVRGRIVHIDR